MTTTPCSDGGDQHNEEQVFRGTRFEVWSCFDCGKERIIDYADPANGDISEEIWVSVSVLSVKVVRDPSIDERDPASLIRPRTQPSLGGVARFQIDASGTWFTAVDAETGQVSMVRLLPQTTLIVVDKA